MSESLNELNGEGLCGMEREKGGGGERGKTGKRAEGFPISASLRFQQLETRKPNSQPPAEVGPSTLFNLFNLNHTKNAF